MSHILKLYPRSFRDRYGDEIALLLESSPTPRRDLLDVFWQALLDRTEYTMSLTWRRAPRWAGFALLWLLGAYAFGFITEHARSMIIGAALDGSLAVPALRDDLFQMRLLTAFCVAVAASIAFLLARRYGRGRAAIPIAALALVSLVGNVLRVDAYALSHIMVSVNWDWFVWSLIEQVLWVSSAIVLVLAIRRSRWPLPVAIVGTVVVAYANTVGMTALLDKVFALPGNPWTTYWESIMGAVFMIVTDGVASIFVTTNGWWPTIATAIVAGTAYGARSRQAAAYSVELVS